MLYRIYTLLFSRYGAQHWWPADTPFEVMVGAVLTQSAAWANVEKAITNLKAANVLSPAAMRDISLEELAGLIRCSGYFNAKARKLKALVGWLGEQGDNIELLSKEESAELRGELLAVHGIGPETADSILLYAAGKPVFVIDAYTRRIFERLGTRPPAESYDDWQRLFIDALKPADGFFNEYHALLVRLGKEVCRKKSPRCGNCCLAELCVSAAESDAHSQPVLPRSTQVRRSRISRSKSSRKTSTL